VSLDLHNLIEVAADEVASVGRAAAGSINELVHDWGHETRAFVADHAPSLPSLPSLPTLPTRTSRSNVGFLRVLIPVLVLSVVAYMVFKRKRPGMSPHLPTVEETPATTKPRAEGAAAH
jgi:hypothetical protein